MAVGTIKKEMVEGRGKLGSQVRASQSQTRLSRTERLIQRKKVSNINGQLEQYQRELSEAETLEEYEEKYNKLDPRYRQYFKSPDSIRQQESSEINTTKNQVQNRIKEVEQKIVDLTENYQKNKKRYQERGRDTERLTEKYYESKERYKGQIEGLKEGLNELNKGKNLSYNSILSYSTDVGNYEADVERSRKKPESIEGEPFIIEEYQDGVLEKAGVEVKTDKGFKRVAELDISKVQTINETPTQEPAQVKQQQVYADGQVQSIERKKIPFFSTEQSEKIQRALLTENIYGFDTKGVGRFVYETGQFVGDVASIFPRVIMLDPTLLKEGGDFAKNLFDFGKEKTKRLIKGETVFPEVGEVAYREPGYVISLIGGEIVTSGAISYTRTRIIPSVKANIQKGLPNYRPIEEVSPGLRFIKDVDVVTPERSAVSFDIEGLRFKESTPEIFGQKVLKRERVQVGIIPSKQTPKKTPTTPLESGPYGFTPEQQASYIGEEVFITSTARGLVKTKTGTSTTIKSFEKGIDPVTGEIRDFGAFFSPPDPVTGQPITRASRLGDKQRIASIFDITGGNLDPRSGGITFKGTGEPQFVFTKQVIGGKNVAPFGRGIQKGVPTSELEVELLIDKIIKPLEVSGATVIDGRRVPLISVDVLEPSKSIKLIKQKVLNEKKLSVSEKIKLKKEDPLFYERFISSRDIESKRLVDLTGNIAGLLRFNQDRSIEVIKRVQEVSSTVPSSTDTVSRVIQEIKTVPSVSVPRTPRPRKSIPSIRPPTINQIINRVSRVPRVPSVPSRGPSKLIPRTSLTTPMLTPVKFPEIKTPKNQENNVRRLRIRKEEEYFGYIPDFTSRALELKPTKVSEETADKLVKEVLSGFELRKGVVVK